MYDIELHDDHFAQKAARSSSPGKVNTSTTTRSSFWRTRIRGSRCIAVPMPPRLSALTAQCASHNEYQRCGAWLSLWSSTCT